MATIIDGDYTYPNDCLACPPDCQDCSKDETCCECYTHEHPDDANLQKEEE